MEENISSYDYTYKGNTVYLKNNGLCKPELPKLQKLLMQ